MPALSAAKALIFRITHVDNLEWIATNGIHCRSSTCSDPTFRNIGNVDLIDKRASRQVPIDPGGTLSSYVPFYFTSRSPMLLNLKTGRGVPAVPMRDVAILVSSLHHLEAKRIPYVFTDRHAYLETATYYRTIDQLTNIDWDILSRSDFRRDPLDIDKMSRYMAEALVYEGLQVDGLLGIVCYDAPQAARVQATFAAAGHDLRILVKPEYYF